MYRPTHGLMAHPPDTALASVLAACLALSAGCLPAGQLADYAALGLPAFAAPSAASSQEDRDPLGGATSLAREELLTAVLQRNPTVEAARQAFGLARSPYPQVTAFADPTLALEAAPSTVGSEAGYGQMIRLGQRLEWPGKQALRAAMALAETRARGAELAQLRLDLALRASLLFDEAQVLQRALEINLEHVALVARLRQSAVAQYAAGRGSQQDPLQADVELALLDWERLGLEGLEALLSTIVRWTAGDPDRRGCLVINAIPEASSLSEDTRHPLQNGLRAFHGIIRQRCLEARDDLGLTADIDIHGLAAVVSAATVGIRVMGRAGQSRRQLQAVADGAMLVTRRCLQNDSQ